MRVARRSPLGPATRCVRLVPQIREVYSSGAWLGLALPGGGGAAPGAQWTLPPRTTRPLVRLLLHPPAPLCAYIRYYCAGSAGYTYTCLPLQVYLSRWMPSVQDKGQHDRWRAGGGRGGGPRAPRGVPQPAAPAPAHARLQGRARHGDHPTPSHALHPQRSRLCDLSVRNRMRCDAMDVQGNNKATKTR